MPAAPKPKKAERTQEKKVEHRGLVEYRRAQSALAISRDNNQCVFCWFLLGIAHPREEIHHCYGRGDEAGDWRESYENLMSTCKHHHPPPIQTPGSSKLDWVEWVRKEMNEQPINPKFKRMQSGD